ncbi:MAG: beta-propeller fold lactonase family protein [Terracidiphilus sp.]|jgi:6-phosphogluconolactonase (cycloisomerase 2 family)
MKFMKFGKALLIVALSVGVVLSVTSCVQSYTVGFLYVTGTATAQSSGSGIISGFKIDHNTGQLTTVNGLPIPSGGTNPGRAVLLNGSRFLYVLNRGSNAQGGSVCTTANPCQNSNITQFTVGGNGILTSQETFYTQGFNPMRILSDGSGTYLFVLDHDAPDSNAYTGKNLTANSCTEALGGTTTSCGDITVFSINSSTGRLSLVQNNQVTSANCPNNELSCPLTYFPVPANPIDFLFSASYILTLSGTPATGDTVFPYAEANGQLTVTQNSSQPMNIAQATAIVSGGSYVYVLDNEPITANGTLSYSQILPFSLGTGGALVPQTGGAVPDDPTLSNPIYLLVESKGKFAYVANQGNNTSTTNAQSGLAGYVIDPTTHQLSYIAGEPFGTGAGPQCLVEDPSDQFIYTANFNDSTVTGRVVDPNSGVLNNFRVASSYALSGPPAWCLVDGRTN